MKPIFNRQWLAFDAMFKLVFIVLDNDDIASHPTWSVVSLIVASE